MSKHWLVMFGVVFSLVALTACGGGELDGDTDVIDMDEPAIEDAPTSGQPETEEPVMGEEPGNSDVTEPTTPEGQFEEDPAVDSEIPMENEDPLEDSSEDPLEDPTSEMELNEEDGVSESDPAGNM